MSKRHPELVHYIDIQNILTNYLSEGKQPTSQQLQERCFGTNYLKDSRYQAEVVYNAIQRGRKQAIEKWSGYIETLEFYEYMKDINEKESERITAELNSEDYDDFNKMMLDEDTPPRRRKLMEEFDQHPVIAVVFRDKMWQYSRQKNNFVISAYGKNSTWFIPSFWAWNIREYHLYRRSIDTLGKQLERGQKTSVLLPSKVPIKKVLGYRTNIEAALMDGTSWRCQHCGAYNIASINQCTVCETTKEAIV